MTGMDELRKAGVTGAEFAETIKRNALAMARAQVPTEGVVSGMEELVASAAEQEATIQVLKTRLLTWADDLERDGEWPVGGDAARAVLEMRQTAEEL